MSVFVMPGVVCFRQYVVYGLERPDDLARFLSTLRKYVPPHRVE